MLGGCFKQQNPVSNAHSIVELLVRMDCEGCEKRVRKALSEMQGVDSMNIDMEKQKVTVTGNVDKKEVLKVVRRSGKKAEFWPYPYESEYHPYVSEYYDTSDFSSSYNYYIHGYNEPSHGYFPDPLYATVSDEIKHRFSDDNVHACSIM